MKTDREAFEKLFKSQMWKDLREVVNQMLGVEIAKLINPIKSQEAKDYTEVPLVCAELRGKCQILSLIMDQLQNDVDYLLAVEESKQQDAEEI